MKYPKTADEWWANLNAAWSDILEIFANCGAPMTPNEDGRWFSDGIGEEPTRHDKALIQILEDAKRDRNHATLHLWLQRCWSAAPDAPYIHQWRNWGTLCDLCSEYEPCFGLEGP